MFENGIQVNIQDEVEVGQKIVDDWKPPGELEIA